jgi:hypothetical protein
MGTIDPSCVTLIMAMSMQCTFVPQFLSCTLAVRGDVINFDDVSVLKEQFTPATFPSCSLALTMRFCMR